MRSIMNHTYQYYLIYDEIITHITRLRDLRLMSSALVNKKMTKVNTFGNDK